MPRPKRVKVTPLLLSTSPRVVNPLGNYNDRQPDIAPSSSYNVTSNSDDSDGLVTMKKTSTNQSISAPNQATMSGALMPGDTLRTRSKPLGGRRRALFSKVMIDPRQNEVIEALKARRDAAPAVERTSQIEVPSTTSSKIASTELQPVNETNSMLGNVDVQSSSGLESKTLGIPEAQGSSSKVSNVKTRPRKLSLLQLVQAQANQQSGDEDDDLDDFLPNDESTPLVEAKPTKPQLDPPSSPLPTNQTSSSRKRKLSEADIQVPMTQPADYQVSAPASLSPTPESDAQADLFGIPYENELPEPSLPLPRSARAQSPKVWSDTLAPPQSSSSPIHRAPNKPAKALTKPRARKKPSQGSDPCSSPPAFLQPKSVFRPLKPLSTATLQNLLPRRRARPNLQETSVFEASQSSDAEIDISGLGADEDELSIPAKPRGRPRKRDARPGSKPARSAKSKAKVHSSLATSSRKTSQKNVSSGPAKTYSRAKSTPNRNENLPNDEDDHGDRNDRGTTSNTDEHNQLDSRPSEELRRLAAKFREVDEWSLEIEDVTASSETLKDAR